MVKPGLQTCVFPMVASIVNNDNDRLRKGNNRWRTHDWQYFSWAVSRLPCTFISSHWYLARLSHESKYSSWRGLAGNQLSCCSFFIPSGKLISIGSLDIHAIILLAFACRTVKKIFILLYQLYNNIYFITIIISHFWSYFILKPRDAFTGTTGQVLTGQPSFGNKYRQKCISVYIIIVL